MGRRGATSAAAEAGAPGNASDDPEVEATRFDNPLNDEIDEQKEKAVGKAKNEIDEQGESGRKSQEESRESQEQVKGVAEVKLQPVAVIGCCVS